MGDRSEVFCRQTLLVLDQNRQIIPPGIDLDDARRRHRNGSEHDMLTTALGGYGVARVLGKGAGLDALRETMSVCLGRRGKNPEAAGAR